MQKKEHKRTNNNNKNETNEKIEKIDKKIPLSKNFEAKQNDDPRLCLNMEIAVF